MFVLITIMTGDCDGNTFLTLLYIYIYVCVWFQYDIVDLVMFTRFENGSLLNRSKRWFQQCIRIVTITFRSIRITRKVVISLFWVVCASYLRYRYHH